MTGKPVVCTALLLSFLCIQPNLLDALESPAPPDSAVTVSIIDGTRLTGQIVSRNDAGILLVTPANLEIKIPLPRSSQ